MVRRLSLSGRASPNTMRYTDDYHAGGHVPPRQQLRLRDR